MALTFTLGLYLPFLILTVLQRLKERKSDMLSKLYSPKKRSFCEHNLGASFFLSLSPVSQDIVCIVFLFLFILHLPTYNSG